MGASQGPGTLNFSSGLFANGTQVITGRQEHINAKSISGTSIAALNLRGACTFEAARTCSVTFGTPEPNASYFISLGCNANKTFWWSAKATTGFTINASTSSSDSCDWILIR